MESPERDRYDALLRQLQAGREIRTPATRRRAFGLPDIHPIAGRLLLLAVLVAVGWLAAIRITDAIRIGRVDTWAGPDASVQSGLRLAGCPDFAFPEDPYFPSWVRFDGFTYIWAGRALPIVDDVIGTSYERTGYTNGSLELFRIISNPEGRAGREILMREGQSAGGAVYVLSDCG